MKRKMELIKQNLQALIDNYTNNNIVEYVNSYENDERINLDTLKDFININTKYYLTCKSQDIIELDDSKNLIKNTINYNKKTPIIEQTKTKGRPKKPEIEKLMNSIMILVSKYVEKEKDYVEKTVKEKFSLLSRVDNENIEENDNVKRESNNINQDLSHISNALINAVNGNKVENVEKIQESIKEISETNERNEENVHIEVIEIVISGDKYLIDEHDNLYDFETHNIVGSLDKKRGNIDYI